jgi:hypothetical protein
MRYATTLFALAALLILFAAPALAQPVRVVVDGQTIAFDQPPVMAGGRVLVPLRGVFENLGATVVWDPATRSIRATRGDTSVLLTMGSRLATVNGQVTTLDTPAMIAGGRTLVPLRFVSEAMGADVEWRGATRTVLIRSEVAMEPPLSPSPPVSARPEIDTIVHTGASISAGQNLQVMATGTAGGTATFDVLGTGIRNVGMIEVSPGRYEGNITIPSGTVASNATLVVHLRKDGQEDVEQAATPLAIGTGGGTLTGIQVTPASGSTVYTTRPTIEVSVPSTLRAETVRLMLNGVDVTGQAQFLLPQVGLTGDRSVVRFTPGYNLLAGIQNVTFQGYDTSGNFLRQDWSFNVSGTATGTLIQSLTLSPDRPLGVGETLTASMQGQSGGTATLHIGPRSVAMVETGAGFYQGSYTVQGSDLASYPISVTLRMPDGRSDSRLANRTLGTSSGGTGTGFLPVSLTSPSSGSTVGNTFTVTGTTGAYAQVTVLARITQPLIPGVIGIDLGRVTNTAVADASGHFSVPIDISAAPMNSRIIVTATARDTVGNTSTSPEITLTRR